MTKEDDAFQELVRLSEELGLYDMPAVVCVAHMRFIPCRKSGEHVYSTKPEDVKAVREFQS